MSNSIAEIENNKVLFVIGSDTADAHPIVALRMKKAVRKGAKLIVADPRRVKMVDFAHLWLRHRPGTDVALINTMMHIIIKEGLADSDYLENNTRGFKDFEENLAAYTPEYGEEVTGVPKEDIIEAAKIYAEAEGAGIFYCLGITHHSTGTDNVFALADLALLTNNIGREFAGVNPLRGQNNVQGACDMGCLPGDLPGYQKVTDEAARSKFEEIWGRPIPDKKGITAPEMTEAMHSGALKAMYIMGENPVISDQNMHHTVEGLKRLDFLVVQDIFLTETAKLADVVLPAACFAEKKGTFTNTERRIQLIRKALEPPGEAKDDLTIINMITARLGYDYVRQSVEELGYQVESESSEDCSPEEIFQEIGLLWPAMAGMCYRRLKEGGLQWPCPGEDHPGTRYLYENGFSVGKPKFQQVSYEPAQELPDAEYPLILITGRFLFRYNTSTMELKTKAIEEVSPEPYIEINLEDARNLGIKNGEMVNVSSRRGQIDLAARVEEDLTAEQQKVSPGVVFIPFHYQEAPANVLTSDFLDPIAKTPEMKFCTVKVKKVETRKIL